MSADLLGKLDALERKLAGKGFPAMSPFWRTLFARFATSGKRRLVVRGGRRSGKSTSVIRWLVLEALYGEHVIPPGDVGIIGIVSVSRSEAASRLRLVRAILSALGVKFTEKGDTIELQNRPVMFAVMTATKSGVVGGTWIGALCDEVAYWRDSETGANPATEVLGELRPTMATQPRAREFMVSAPLGSEDAHALTFDVGEDETQIVAHVPTWVGNPTITEDDCAKLERDPKRRARLYGAIPQVGATSAFDADDVARAFVPREVPPTASACAPVCLIDASSGRADSWTWAIARWYVPNAHQKYKLEKRYIGGGAYGWDYVFGPDGRPVEADPEDLFRPLLAVEHVAGFDGAFANRLRADEVVSEVVRSMRGRGAVRVIGDQREAFALAALFAQKGVHFTSLPWTNPTKETAVETLRRWFRDGDLALVGHAKLKEQLGKFSEKITPNGSFSYGARTGHDDYAALLLTLAMAEAEGLVSGSPLAPRVHRHIPAGHTA